MDIVYWWIRIFHRYLQFLYFVLLGPPVRLGMDEVHPDLSAEGLLVAGETERLPLALEGSNALIYDELRIQMDLILKELRYNNIFTMQHSFTFILTRKMIKIEEIEFKV